MGIKLTLLLEAQPEGVFTITCKELPELITECDLSLHNLDDNVEDALDAVIQAYNYRKRPLPESVFCSDESVTKKRDKPIFETVVAFNEVSRNNQKTETTWL